MKKILLILSMVGISFAVVPNSNNCNCCQTYQYVPPCNCTQKVVYPPYDPCCRLDYFAPIDPYIDYY